MDIGSRNTGTPETIYRDVVHQYYNDGAYHQEDAVLRNRSPVVATLCSQRTGSTEYLCDGDEAKERKIIQITLSPLNMLFNKSNALN